LPLLILELDNEVVSPLLEFPGIVHQHNIYIANLMRLDRLQLANVSAATIAAN
jgi:hypothetical protein